MSLLRRDRMTTAEVWDHWLEDLAPEFEDYTIGHPSTCFAIHHWHPEPGAGGLLSYAPHLSLERPRCVIEWEAINVGLTDQWPHNEWASLWVEDYPGGEDAIMELVARHAAAGSRMPIFVTVTYGWSPSTPNAPAEYEWEFAWRPQTPEEIAERAATGSAVA